MVVPASELGLIERVPMFARSRWRRRSVWRANFVSLSVDAGQVVFRVGEAEESFYIVGEDELDIVAEGLHRTAKQADYFDEIVCCDPSRGRRR